MIILLFALSVHSPQAIARALVEKYDAAWMRKDAAGFAALLSPEYVYFSSDGKIMDRKAVLSMLASPDYRIDAGSRDEFRTFVSGSVVIAVTPKPTVLAEHCTNLPATSSASPGPASPMPQ